MNELDEMQGLTADMVREWLKEKKRPQDSAGYWWWNPLATRDKRGPCLDDRLLDCSMSTALTILSAIENLPLQSLLRQMNPRLIPWPSDALIEAHRKDGGEWIMRDTDGELHIGGFSDDEEDGVRRFWWDLVLLSVSREESAGLLFWPVDAAGNKVRLPEAGQ